MAPSTLKRGRQRYPADIPGAETGSDLSNKGTLLALILAAAVIAEANPSLHGCLVPEKFRNDPRALHPIHLFRIHAVCCSAGFPHLYLPSDYLIQSTRPSVGK
ncbi:unnamed protein product [Rangifer tarandus platyrhynchus]|uniref:Uncharacterized protein n=1 Tax=Rangifer tarandus platyrhynchus TaxID=3082113 RepID=A0AC59ZSF6_RANTA